MFFLDNINYFDINTQTCNIQHMAVQIILIIFLKKEGSQKIIRMKREWRCLYGLIVQDMVRVYKKLHTKERKNE
ncbi:hypothetical protein BIY37_03395 [Candidatus Brocadia sapporoensis]|uniref:Uncharacterized protein n=1 Tax=Candidatus Brocadia sapporoensis TaxID=392547 RepID=A0A1V6M1Z6_9BACT|nr:hypothetical protein BIY37_03395 [Candidatus Brocadia sapporoensis]GJQ24370.1 MAG: hypothetical protein HBSAPP01_21600 [Candidatus Brocadia sapporoensis]